MVAWLEVFLIILFVVSLADVATSRSKSSLNSQAEGERKELGTISDRNAPLPPHVEQITVE